MLNILCVTSMRRKIDQFQYFVGIGAYWRRKDLKSWKKETWTSGRSGNLLRGGEKGVIKHNFRGCKKVTENWEHVIEVMQRLGAESKGWWQDSRTKSSQEQTVSNNLSVMKTSLYQHSIRDRTYRYCCLELIERVVINLPNPSHRKSQPVVLLILPR